MLKRPLTCRFLDLSPPHTAKLSGEIYFLIVHFELKLIFVRNSFGIFFEIFIESQIKSHFDILWFLKTYSFNLILSDLLNRIFARTENIDLDSREFGII